MESPEGPRTFSLIGFARLVRLGNLLLIVLTQYVAGIFLIGEVGDWRMRLADPALLLIALSTACIAAGGYIINDYYDVKIDVINRPDRVVIDRLLKRRVAMGAHLVLSLVGIALGGLLGWRVLALNALSVFLLWLYSNQLKRLPLVGNVTVSLLTALTLVVMAAYYRQNELLLLIFATYAFFITLVREVVKDMEDMRGDATHGCRTLPIVWGVRRTKQLLYVLIAVFIAVLFSMSGQLPNPLIGYFFFVLLVPITWLVIRLVYADTVRAYGYLSRLCKAIMLLGVLSMVFL